MFVVKLNGSCEIFFEDFRWLCWLQFYLKPCQMLFVLACCQKVFVVQVWFVLVFNLCCHIRRRWVIKIGSFCIFRVLRWLAEVVPGHGSDCRWRRLTLAVRPRPHGFMMVKIDFYQNTLTIYKKQT
ncbi:hypothetical protein HanRHA438_Chr07g0303491 [Helianthus annuus]|uniref:Uncharacterized protein n=1 Tax=Helianthus annuus TaxID=4232 RepID=A0A251T2K5_HELAN|nr:hypothetical protein HanXRQr2_Chr07g0293071 [Helianthus annuus]KAJ0550042.1 hypothetical protein HanHA300_Chr07g0240911 [Helianthus annuus]KAJ0562999.1 hypothetical protein HanHA89_Chr07g0258111 [Helianthus annuus]KAJ0728370.1 hypothetical protein HanLR1_Chr07g0240821 [Helianthus annuus]KAJ0731128.1 hypothetical protein HanOQP8_Chr07g0248401 [Helianthus annuus]